MLLRLRRLALIVATAATLLGSTLAFAPAASASNGGCRNSPGTPYGTIGACINPGGGNINSDAYLNFSSIPRGCSTSISLYKVVGGRGYLQFTVNPPCRKGYLGVLIVSQSFEGHGTYYNVSCVGYNGGGACGYSPYLNI